MAEPLLSTGGLCKSFGAITATRDLDLDIGAGEIHALIGPNGAGKTTLVAQLAGELRPDAGVVRFAGQDITRLPVHARARLGLARSFQLSSVFPGLSAEQNLTLAIQAHAGHSFRFWRPVRRDPALMAPARAALARVGLQGQAAVPAGRLSHGEKRQLEVAMALAGNPRLLLLDEPMAGLGPGGTRRLTELVGRLKGQLAMLLVEHDMQAVFALADRVTVLVDGAALATGTPAAIRDDPRVQRAYLGGGDVAC